SQNPSSNKGASPLTHDTSTLNREWPLNGDPTEQPRAKIENKENSKNDNHWPGGHPHQIRDGPFRKPQPVIFCPAPNRSS
ncbi:hypothetical protein, partial [Micrococcus luteus]|uniref:hypothetical protein n=1 Tax=Micrococcus luteus TaxID=1270 RepID=UPI002550205C